MKRAGVFLMAVVGAILFVLVESSYAWSIGNVLRDKKDMNNFVIEILDPEINTFRVAIEVTITPNFKPSLLDSFDVKEEAELAGKDRDEVKKVPPPKIIWIIDQVIREIKEKMPQRQREKATVAFLGNP